ncbi:penicillin-binding protein 2 [Massilibacillus massiliensis]
MVTTKEFKGRIEALSIIGIAVIFILIFRLGYLQVFEGDYYSRLADGNRIRLIPSMAPRGLFYDRNGALLVSNRPGFTVSLLSLSGPVSDGVVERLASLLKITKEDIYNKINQHTGFDPIRIKNDVGPEIITVLEEQKEDFPGVVIEIQPIRNYVNMELGAHIFGYVSEINDTELEARKGQGYKAGDIIGKFGLEKVYDKELRGMDGGGQVEVDVTGKPVQILGKKEPIPGCNLTLTIDENIQKAAEQAIDERLLYLQTKTQYKKAKAAAAVVLNPNTGEIVAMVSRPAFNPNLFARGISTKDWNLINNNAYHPLDNKVISGEYPPGSTFKVITGAAALEENKVTPEEQILDTGKHWIIPKVNADGEALGWIDFRVALAKSDNVYFYEMGNRLGIDLLEKYARIFGLGDKTGINLPYETEGLVANRRYKEKVYEEDWYLSETFDAAIGQGFNLTSPLQIADVYAQIANGGTRYRPYLVSKITAPDGSLIKSFSPEKLGSLAVSKKTMDIIRESLRNVALEGGTAGALFKDFPVAIAGKTGTAENPHGNDHGWFVAYGPYENPEYVVVVVVEQGGYGATSAVPIGKKILEAAFHIEDPEKVDKLPIKQ